VFNYALNTKRGFSVRSLKLHDVTTAFNAACKRSGILDFHFHDLRHTFASQVLLRGGDLKDIQELLGHKTMTMTLRYAHLTQEHKRKAINLLNGLTAGKPVEKRPQKKDDSGCKLDTNFVSQTVTKPIFIDSARL
jgi:integrase